MPDQRRNPFYIQVLNSIVHACPPTHEADLVRTMGPAMAQMIDLLVGENAIERVKVPGDVSYFIITPIGMAELTRYFGHPVVPVPPPEFLPEPILYVARSLTETSGTAALYADALLGGTSVNITSAFATELTDIDELVASSVNETIGAAKVFVEQDLEAASVTETIGAVILTSEADLDGTCVTETSAAVDILVGANLEATSVNETEVKASMTVCAASSIPGLVGDFNGAIEYGAGAWLDQSSEGNDLTLTGTTAGVGLNGYGTVLFSGALDKATRSSFSIGSGSKLTIFFVGKVVSTSLLGKILSYDGIKHMLVENVLSGDNPQYVNGVSTAVGGGISGAFHVLCARDTGVLLTGEIELFIDGVSTGTPSIPLNTCASSAAFAIGGLGLDFSNIDVARVLVYNRDLDVNERSLVTEMLEVVYGL